MAITEATVERLGIAHAQTRAHRGIALCLVSAASFGVAAVFAKESFAAGVTVPTLLSARFGIAAVVFWAIVAARRPRWPSLRALLIATGLGARGGGARRPVPRERPRPSLSDDEQLEPPSFLRDL